MSATRTAVPAPHRRATKFGRAAASVPVMRARLSVDDTRARTRFTMTAHATTIATDTSRTPCTTGTSPLIADWRASWPSPGIPNTASVMTAPPTRRGTCRPSMRHGGAERVAERVAQHDAARGEAAHGGSDDVVLRQRAHEAGAQLAGDRTPRPGSSDTDGSTRHSSHALTLTVGGT